MESGRHSPFLLIFRLQQLTALFVISTMQKLVLIACLVIMASVACTFTQKVKTGMQAYEVKQYSVAAQLFEKEYSETNNPAEKAKLAFLAGESYKHLNDMGSAGNWYMKAYKDGSDEQALLSYANAMKYQERYEEALGAYEDLFQKNTGIAAYRSQVTLVKQALEWSRNPNTSYEIRPAAFNSQFADYAPQPIGPGQVLFTSDRESRDTKDTYLWTGRAYSDLYVTNAASQVTPFSSIINSDGNEGTAIISPDGNVLVFTRCFVGGSYDAWCQLMYSIKKGAGWSEPEVFPFVKDKINYGHPAFAANGTTLFFSSDAPAGQGGHDIYFTQSDGHGGWSEPANLGSMVNTMGQEQYPTVYNDTLYYSSDQIAGLGGLDIFKTWLNADNQWVAPINLRAPINSGGDDFGFVVDTFATIRAGELMKGYFTSARAGTSRNDDIYSFTLKGVVPEPTDVATIPDEKVTEQPLINYQVYLSLRVVEPIYEIPDDPNSRKTGKRPLPNGPVIMSEGLMDERFVTDDKGYVLLKLDLDKKYTFTARYRDHLSASYSINTGDLEKEPFNPIITVNQILELDPIFKNKEIVLENIFYDYDQWFIRDDAKPSLNALSNIMKSNPAIKIQLSSHTDCRGTDEYNQDLSQKRAQAAIEYLMSVGIPARRLVAQGFGESAPAVTCNCDNCTEEQHQKNRRTTFKIID